jgi:trimeric autotransporter adhesin
MARTTMFLKPFGTMYTRLPFRPRIAPSLLLLSAFLTQLSTTFAQGTAFSYQGRLNDGANPANGSYDLRFIAYDNSVGGSQQGSISTSSGTAVSNGLFTVTLDFGAIFPGSSRWLEIAVRTNGAGGFTTLSPRQSLTPTPYAITAENVTPSGLTGTYGSAVTFNNAGNSFSGNGAGLTGVNAATLAGLSSSNLWKTGGNAGTVPGVNFIGTTDNQPFDVRVNNVRAMRYGLNTDAGGNYTNVPNVIGGSSANTVPTDVVGAFIGGGGGNKSLDGSSIGNKVTANLGAVCGGHDNIASGIESFVGGGVSNSAYGGPGGIAFVGGGLFNTANGNGATIGGGAYNTAAGIGATVPGGQFNDATGNNSFASGWHAKAISSGTFIWADASGSDFTSTAANQFLIRATGGVGIGTAAPQTPLHVAGASGITLGVSATSGGYTALRIDLSSVSNGYAELQAIKQSGASYGNLILETVGGSVGIGKSNPASTLDVNGTITCISLNQTSDRDTKENFTGASSREVLAKVLALPLSSWNFKNDPATRHIGPMAQDFYRAFNVGTDDKHIATVDEGGVALAAIQGLNQKLEEEHADSQAKDARIAALEAELLRLQQMMEKLANSRN